MFVTSLTDREVETLIQALRYWRRNRRDQRRGDDLLTREETDLLLAKLALGVEKPFPTDDPRPGTSPR